MEWSLPASPLETAYPPQGPFLPWPQGPLGLWAPASQEGAQWSTGDKKDLRGGFRIPLEKADVSGQGEFRSWAHPGQPSEASRAGVHSQGAGKTRTTTARWPEEGTLGTGSLGTLGLEKEPLPTATSLGRALHQETSRCPPGPPGKQPHVSVR